eukprot:scaffold29050_cov112-Isochrysis_galbana.AAC.5
MAAEAVAMVAMAAEEQPHEGASRRHRPPMPLRRRPSAPRRPRGHGSSGSWRSSKRSRRIGLRASGPSSAEATSSPDVSDGRQLQTAPLFPWMEIEGWREARRCGDGAASHS